MGISQMGLYMVEFDLDLQGHLWSTLTQSSKNEVFRTLIFLRIELGSPNSDIRCIKCRSCMDLYMAEFDLNIQGHLGQKVKKWACRHNNLQRIEARFTKFGHYVPKFSG